jgi:hypothetical protein
MVRYRSTTTWSSICPQPDRGRDVDGGPADIFVGRHQVRVDAQSDGRGRVTERVGDRSYGHPPASSMLANVCVNAARIEQRRLLAGPVQAPCDLGDMALSVAPDAWAPGLGSQHRRSDEARRAVGNEHRKLTEMIVFLADRIRDCRLAGSTKLNKLLWFAEISHFRRYGRPISGAEYQHLPQGPAPRALRPIRDHLVSTGQAALRTRPTAVGLPEDRLLPRRAPDMTVFSAEELATLEVIVEEYRDATGSELSDLSHADAGWRYTEDGETIPFASALVDPEPEVTDEVREKARRLAARLGR